MTIDEVRSMLERAERATKSPWEWKPYEKGRVQLEGSCDYAAFIAASREDVPALCRALIAHMEALADDELAESSARDSCESTSCPQCDERRDGVEACRAAIRARVEKAAADAQSAGD